MHPYTLIQLQVRACYEKYANFVTDPERCCSHFDRQLCEQSARVMFKDIASSVAKRVPKIMILWPLHCRYAGEIKGMYLVCEIWLDRPEGPYLTWIKNATRNLTSNIRTTNGYIFTIFSPNESLISHDMTTVYFEFKKSLESKRS